MWLLTKFLFSENPPTFLTFTWNNLNPPFHFKKNTLPIPTLHLPHSIFKKKHSRTFRPQSRPPIQIPIIIIIIIIKLSNLPRDWNSPHSAVVGFASLLSTPPAQSTTAKTPSPRGCPAEIREVLDVAGAWDSKAMRSKWHLDGFSCWFLGECHDGFPWDEWYVYWKILRVHGILPGKMVYIGGMTRHQLCGGIGITQIIY